MIVFVKIHSLSRAQTHQITIIPLFLVCTDERYRQELLQSLRTNTALLKSTDLSQNKQQYNGSSYNIVPHLVCCVLATVLEEKVEKNVQCSLDRCEELCAQDVHMSRDFVLVVERTASNLLDRLSSNDFLMCQAINSECDVSLDASHYTSFKF